MLRVQRQISSQISYVNPVPVQRAMRVASRCAITRATNNNQPVRLIDIQMPRKFQSLFDERLRYFSAYGGRGAGKSWAFADASLALGTHEKHRILCTREYQSTISDSVYRLLCDRIKTLHLDYNYTIFKNAIKGKNGTEYLFKGLQRNIEEIKSTEGIDICWVEEAQNTSEHSWEVLIPTIFRRKKSRIWLSWNMGEVSDPTYQRFVVNKPPGITSVKVGWQDNPFFPENLKKEMLYLKKVDYESYMHIWEGEPLQISNACIFKGKYEVADFEVPNDVRIFQGADWGFSNDPCVLISFFIQDNNMYISHEAYGVGVELDEIPQHFSAVPTYKKFKISADSSRPETISYLKKQHELNVESAKKWKGSVEDGISYMKKFGKIVINPRCTHTIEEMKKYRYKTDPKTQEVLPIIIDKDNHCIDSIRYGLDDYINNDVSFADFVG